MTSKVVRLCEEEALVVSRACGWSLSLKDKWGEN